MEWMEEEEGRERLIACEAYSGVSSEAMGANGETYGCAFEGATV